MIRIDCIFEVIGIKFRFLYKLNIFNVFFRYIFDFYVKFCEKFLKNVLYFYFLYIDIYYVDFYVRLCFK